MNFFFTKIHLKTVKDKKKYEIWIKILKIEAHLYIYTIDAPYCECFFSFLFFSYDVTPLVLYWPKDKWYSMMYHCHDLLILKWFCLFVYLMENMTLFISNEFSFCCVRLTINWIIWITFFTWAYCIHFYEEYFSYFKKLNDI